MPSRETISLYCKAGTADKVYHIQLDGYGSVWTVCVQYGRRLATSLKEELKTPVPVTWGAAKRIYDDLVREKTTKKGYHSGVLAGKSAITAAPAAAIVLPPLPTWTDFEYFYVESATALMQPSTLHSAPLGHIVLLADIAAGMQEGAPDAVSQIKRSGNLEDIQAMLSKEGKAWFAKLATEDQEECLAQLKAVCKRA